MSSRIETQITIGTTNPVEYNTNRIANLKRVSDIDRNANSLAYSVFTFDLMNVNTVPKSGQKVKLYRNDMTNPVLTYTLGLPVAKGEKTYSCTAYSAIALLVGKMFVIDTERALVGHYYTNASAADVIADIVDGDVPIEVSSGLSAKTVTGFIEWKEKRDALQEVLFVTGGMCREKADGTLYFFLPVDDVYSIGADDIFADNIRITETSVANSVTINQYNFTQATPDVTGEFIEYPLNNYYRKEQQVFSYTVTLPLGVNGCALSVSDSMLVNSSNVQEITTRVAGAFAHPITAQFKRANYTESNTLLGRYMFADLGYKQVKGYISKVTVYYGVTTNTADVTLTGCEELDPEDLVTLTVRYIADEVAVHTEHYSVPKNSTYVINAPPTYTIYTSSRKGIYATENTTVTGSVGTTDKTIDVPYEIVVEWHNGTLKIYACDAAEQEFGRLFITGEEEIEVE